MSTQAPAIGVVGAGPVGRALAAAYATGGGDVHWVVARRLDRARAIAARIGAAGGFDRIPAPIGVDVIVVAVPGRALSEVAAGIGVSRDGLPRLVLHTSGALPGDAVRAVGHSAGSLHPLQSFPELLDDPALERRVAGSHWFHEGEGAESAAAMVQVWRGTMHRLKPGGKALYHAGAAVLSNHTVALFDAALRLLAAAGVPRDEAMGPLSALLKGTTQNLTAVGVPRALTGPVARGEADTLRRHIEAIAAGAPELLAPYLALSRRALAVSLDGSTADTRSMDEIDELLRSYGA